MFKGEDMYYIYYGDSRNSEGQYTNGKAVLNEQKLVPQKVNIMYPFVVNENNDRIKAKVNEEIIDAVGKLFKNQVLLPEKTDFIEIFVVYEIGINKNYILSILFSIYTYVYHAAHGLTVYSSITINTKTGKTYSFSDLFNPKMNYLGVLTLMVNKYIKDNNIQLINPFKGVTNNQEFYLTDKNLILYYQVYEYTPYYYGIFKVPIPYTEIKNILSPMSPINRLI